ncbi:MAG TPA: TonB-dependent receptor [Thermoanaerobaculia bacterium]
MKAARAVGLLLALVVLFAPPLFSQTVTGTLQGTVTDPSGAPVPGVTVAVKNTETGQERIAVTNDRGFYSVPFLPIGTYDVTATLEGFGTNIQKGLEIRLNSTAVQDLTIGMQMAETVTVIAEQPRINMVNAEVKASLSSQEVIDKPVAPMAGPNAMVTLAETFAGFHENPTSGQNNPTASSGSSVNFGGGTRGTTFQINGVSNDDSSENQHRQGVALSTIKEFQILTSNYSAEFGKAHGAVVLVQTKSGTNQWRGDVYGYLTDNEWNEKSFFSRTLPKPENQRMTYGFTSGFPIMRDKLFAFVSVDRNEFEGDSIRNVEIFTADQKTTIPRLTRGNDTPANRAFIESVLARFPSAAPNNPVLGPRVYGSPVKINQPDDDDTIRLDFDATASHHLTSRYQWSHQIRESTDIVIGENALQDNEQENLGITWTQVLTPSIVGEFRYGLGLRSTNVNIGAGNDTPIIRFTGASPPSIIGNAGAFPINRDQTDNQFVYNANALLWKNHGLKAGVEIRQSELDDFADNFSRGFWTFNRICGGQTYETVFHAFFDGCVQSFSKQWGPLFLENRLNEESVYLEDNWQALAGLTLNIGARYEHVAAPEEAQDRIDYGFDDDQFVDPRLGFAYTLPWDNRVLNWFTGGANNAVVRGGYGYFHGRIFQSVFSQSGASLRTNPPNALFRGFTNSLNIADPTDGFVFVPGPQTLRHTISIADDDLVTPMTKQWNLTFERNMPWNSNVRLSYTSKKGEDLLRYRLGNLPQSPLDGPVFVVDHPNNAPAAGAPDLRGKTITKVNPDPCAGTGLPGAPVNAACPNPVPLGDDEISARVPRINERRADPRYTTLLVTSNDAESEYESVQVEWTKRFTNNLHFYTSYTWSQEFDNVSEATFVGAGDTNQTGPDKKYGWGRSRFDTPHRFTIYGSYRLPFFEGRKDLLGLVLGGWQIAPAYRYATGSPFTVTNPTVDLDFDGFGEGRPVILDRSIEGRTINNPNTSQQQLPAGAFRRVQLGDDPDSLTKRNAFRGDETNRLDLGIYKTFPMPMNDSIVLRLECFNVFDDVQYGFPVTDITNANFGRITSTAAGYQPRTYQVALRYLY